MEEDQPKQITDKESKQEGRALLKFGERKVIDGVVCKYEDTGYTLREYYAHSTPKKGPGPGWDTRTRLLDDAWAMELFGRTFSIEEVFDIDSTKLPDLPLGRWVPVADE